MISTAHEVHALIPRTTRLDDRVLAALDARRGRRATAVAKVLYGTPGYRCEGCGKVTRVIGATARRHPDWEHRTPRRCPEWADGCGGNERRVLLVTDEQAREVREVLRGLERVGKARQSGGWWRRAS